ncbi:MAG: hypothetical protein EPN36_05010 [Rhodanobacteraceae bacterium]|nr:MAG: hypothetical protein EPN36_05010 [Rhodanobacteraceae bacterium]
MNGVAMTLRERRLRALGVEPLRLRRHVVGAVVEPPVVQDAAPVAAQQATMPVATSIRKLALQPDTTELADPALSKMYAALTEAVGKAGLQRVRVCDVRDDPAAAVMVFGAAAVPEGVPLVRVLRVDPLSVLHADRERKRLLWERLQALGRGD